MGEVYYFCIPVQQERGKVMKSKGRKSATGASRAGGKKSKKKFCFLLADGEKVLTFAAASTERPLEKVKVLQVLKAEAAEKKASKVLEGIRKASYLCSSPERRRLRKKKG